MSFLYPAMLAGLAALAAPIALHLIAKHRFPIHDFPSIRLLQADIKTNVFAPRLVDVGQLLLRLLVLALIVLAMARLLGPAWLGGPAARNVVVVLDNSASMRLMANGGDTKSSSLFELAREEARQLLSTIEAPSRCGLIAAGDQEVVLAQLAPSADAALVALDTVLVSDGGGPGIIEAVAQAAEMVRGRREVRSQIIVFTDLRSSAFAARSAKNLRRIETVRNEMDDRLQIVFIDVAGATADNLAMLEADIRGGEVQMGDDAHVVARISNTGADEQTAKVRLSVSDRDEPLLKEITVAPGADAVVDLAARGNRAIRTFAQMRLQTHDALAHDDQFDVPLTVVDHRRVLIVRNNEEKSPDSGVSAVEQLSAGQEVQVGADEPTIDGATIMRFALNPGRELGLAHGTGINTTMVTPDALAGQPLSKYELVILYDVSSLGEAALTDLETFVRQGKGLLMVCSGKCSPVDFNRTLAAAAPKRAAIAPAELGNEETFKSALPLALKNKAHPVLSPFGDPLQGDLSVLQFNTVRQLRDLPEGTSVALDIEGGPPLAVEKQIGDGRVMMLTCGLELDRCNLARARVFPKFLWRLVDYLSGSARDVRPDVLVASRPAVLDVSEPSFALATELELTPIASAKPSDSTAEASAVPAAKQTKTSWRLPVSDNRTVLTAGIPAGRYLLQKPRQAGESSSTGSYARCIAVQPDSSESNLTRVSSEELLTLLGNDVEIAKAHVPADLVPGGGELWTLILVLLLLAYAAEAALGFIQSAQRERRRLA